MEARIYCAQYQSIEDLSILLDVGDCYEVQCLQPIEVIIDVACIQTQFPFI